MWLSSTLPERFAKCELTERAYFSGLRSGCFYRI